MNRSKKNLAWEKSLRDEYRRWEIISILCGSGIGLVLIWTTLVLMYFMFGA